MVFLLTQVTLSDMESEKKLINSHAMKIIFKLYQVDGRPPVNYKVMRAKLIQENFYEIDNIPFFFSE